MKQLLICTAVIWTFALYVVGQRHQTRAFYKNKNNTVLDFDTALEHTIKRRNEVAKYCFHDSRAYLHLKLEVGREEEHHFCGAFNSLDILVHELKGMKEGKM